MDKLLSYQSLAPHLRKFRTFGIYPLNADAPKWHKRFYKVYMCFILFLILLYTVQQILKVYQVRHDIASAIDTMFLLFTNTDALYKLIICWTKTDQIDELLDIMKGPLFNQGVPQHEEILTKTIRQARLFLQGFNWSSVLTCFLWSLYPLILHLQGEHVEFAIWLPFDANMSKQFYIVIVYVWVQTSLLAFINTSMDAFISFLVAQSKTQLSILRFDLENVVKNSKEEALLSSERFQNILEKRFHTIFAHYNEIYRFSKTQQEVFGGPTFYFFLVVTWIICMTAYRIISIKPASVQFVYMIMYMLCIIAEYFVYCFIGSEVYYESEKLTESTYAMDWLQISMERRRELIIFMERIKRPIEPMAVIIPLSNTSFISILRWAFSFYTFLKNSSE